MAQTVFGHIQMSAAEYAYVAGLFKENAKVLNNSLKGKLWLAGGDHASIADYQLAIALAELQQAVMDTNLRNSLNNLNDHFKKVTTLPEFQKRFGQIKQGKKQVLPKFTEASKK